MQQQFPPKSVQHQAAAHRAAIQIAKHGAARHRIRAWFFHIKRALAG